MESGQVGRLKLDYLEIPDASFATGKGTLGTG